MNELDFFGIIVLIGILGFVVASLYEPKEEKA